MEHAINRRNFLGSVSAFASATALGSGITPESGCFKAVLLHLGINYKAGCLPPDMDAAKVLGRQAPATRLHYDQTLWHRLTARMVENGCTAVVIDLNEAFAFPSHPELAVEGSWSVDELREELVRLRGLGLEPIPKLNFSATHDSWLKEYHRMVSTSVYYRVCADVIRDVAEAFGAPRFFHIGFDEETYNHQVGWGGQEFCVVRAGELWWHDLLWLVGEVEKNGSRAWMWSDRGWEHEDFVKRCPKSVLQSNWFYDEQASGFNLDAKDDYTRNCLRLYKDLDKAGFDQVPCGSNWSSGARKKKGIEVNDSFAGLVKFCRENISRDHLKGFLMASWEDWTDKSFPSRTLAGIDMLKGVAK